ncbi:unnamed protein product [Closterium sp. NIES-54]
MVTTTIPGGQRVSICKCTRTRRHLAKFTRRLGSSLYTLAIEPPQVAASAQVSASGQVAASCSCRLLSHQTLLWHHRLGHPSLPRLRGMHSRLLVSGLPRSLPPHPPSPAPPCLPCIEGRQRAAAHSSLFPPTSAPLLTPHMDSVSSSASSSAKTFLSRICTLTKVKNGIAERRIGLVMDVARTSMIHAAAPHFLWPLAVRYAAHQLNLWPRVSLPETSPTLRWTREVGDASVFRVWGSRAFVHNTFADKLSAHAIPCIFLGFVPDTPGWKFYHPTLRCVLPSQDVMFDEPPPAPGSCSLMSQVDPLPGTALVKVAVGSGAARSAASGVAASKGAEPWGAESEGARSGDAEPRGEEPGGAELEGVEPGGSGDAGAGGAGGTGGTAAAGPRGARTRGAGAAGTGGVGSAGAGDPTEPGAPRVEGSCAADVGAQGAGAGGA